MDTNKRTDPFALLADTLATIIKPIGQEAVKEAMNGHTDSSPGQGEIMLTP